MGIAKAVASMNPLLIEDPLDPPWSEAWQSLRLGRVIRPSSFRLDPDSELRAPCLVFETRELGLVREGA